MFTRYIADSSGYIKEVSFGALIECGDDSCVEYTGSVPNGYDSLDAWFMAECETLYKWKIVDGELEFDSEVTEPVEEWVYPPMLDGVEYRTAERWNGKPVYRKLVVYSHSGQLGTSSSNTDYAIPHGISGLVKAVRCCATANDDATWPYIGSTGGIVMVNTVDKTNINLRVYKTYWNSPTIYFDLAYTKE